MMNLLKEGIETGVVIPTKSSMKRTIGGHTEVYPVYKVKLDELYYNDQNDRIATWISQYKAENNVDKIDITNRVSYNNIIQTFIEKSNLQKIRATQTNIELVNQQVPGVILADGRIIDGNRRFTCLRNLAENNLKFDYFETVILDLDIENNARQIKMLELSIQHGEESKVPYNSIDRLVGVYNDLIENKILTKEDYKRSALIEMDELESQIELSEIMVDFLDFIEAPKQFYIAREMNLYSVFVEIPKLLKKVKDKETKEDLKIAIYTNILMKPGSDLVRYIRKISTVINSPYLKEYLEEQKDIAEVVLDKLEDLDEVTTKSLNKQVCNDEETKENLNRSLEKAEMKAKSTTSRNRPLKTLEQVGDKLESIDLNIFKKLDEEQLNDLKNEITRAEELLEIVKEALNF